MPEVGETVAFALGVVLASAVWIGLAVWSCHPLREHDDHRRAADERDEQDEHEEIAQ